MSRVASPTAYLVPAAAALLVASTAQWRLGLAPQSFAGAPQASAIFQPDVPTLGGLTPAAGAPHHFRRSADGMFYLLADANGKSIRFLVDTGATTVVLTDKDAAAIGLDISSADYHQTVRTVGGDARIAQASIDRLRIAGYDLTDVDAAVIEGGAGVSLLGQNALAQLASISIERDQLTLR